MRLPMKTVGTGVLVRSSRYTIGRLRASARAKRLIGPMKAAHDRLKAAQGALNAADDGVIDAQADFDQVRFQAVDALETLSLEATVVVKRDFQDPLYRSLFPKGLTGQKKLTGEALREDLPRVVAALKALPAGHALGKSVKAIGEIEKAWEGPAAVLEEAKVKRATAEAGIKAAREGWFDAYDALAGGLRQEFPREKALVDTFFPVVRNSMRKDSTPSEAAGHATKP